MQALRDNFADDPIGLVILTVISRPMLPEIKALMPWLVTRFRLVQPAIRTEAAALAIQR